MAWETNETPPQSGITPLTPGPGGTDFRMEGMRARKRASPGQNEPSSSAQTASTRGGGTGGAARSAVVTIGSRGIQVTATDTSMLTAGAS